MRDWIDFRELRRKLDFPKILEKYGIKLHSRGTQLVGACPLPQHAGSRNKESFSANTEKGIFQCFSCEAKGNILDFCCLMDGGDPKNGAHLRKSALALQKEFAISSGNKPSQSKNRPSALHSQEANPAHSKVVVNPPLDFSLKDLRTDHPYFTDKCLNSGTVSEFGLGLCSRGYFTGRIVIPLHSPQGILVGYAGRALDDAGPKYLFPAVEHATISSTNSGKQSFSTISTVFPSLTGISSLSKDFALFGG